jgi:hypothetical protein
MTRIKWMICCAGLLFLSGCLFGGCIDLSQSPERECLADRRCGPSEADVCGVDGVEYECLGVATCYGVGVDPSGDACGTQNQCEPVTCELECDDGFKSDENGCEICECQEEPPTCDRVMCEVQCENGFKTDEDGCEICECRESTSESCEDDPCISYHCGGRRGYCSRESELAQSGRCPEQDFAFLEPLPQCRCNEQFCGPRQCGTDEQCTGDDGLCVRNPSVDLPGYCVDATCDDLIDKYGQVEDTNRSCDVDSDCTYYSPAYECCGGFIVNQEGANEMEAIDSFAERTSCGSDWERHCARVDCALPPRVEPSCVQGRCVTPG